MSDHRSPPVSANGHEVVAALSLAAIVLIVFWRASGNGFVDFDDRQYVVQNQDLSKGLTWQGLSWAFTTFHAGNWHPLTWLSLMLDFRLYGLAPRGFHVTNVFLHALNAVLIFWAFRVLTGHIWRSAAV